MSPRFSPALRHRVVAPAALAIALLAGCTTPATPPGAADVTPISLPDVIEGTATYRERIALPPGAVFEAVLEDVSRADAPAMEVARTVLRNPPPPPISFSIGYDPARIDPRHAYSGRARILAPLEAVHLE